MTLVFVLLGTIALIALFVSRALYNWRKRNSEEERTKRVVARQNSRTQRVWIRWRRRRGEVPADVDVDKRP